MELTLPFVTDFEKLSNGRYDPCLYAQRCKVCRLGARFLAKHLTFTRGNSNALVAGLVYTSTSGLGAMWNAGTECYLTEDPPTARRYLRGIALVWTSEAPHDETVAPVAIWEVRDENGDEVRTEYQLI